MIKGNKKKILYILITILIIAIIYFMIPIKYIGISLPTEDACVVCGDPKGEISYTTYKKTLSGNITNIKFDTFSSVYNGSKVDYSNANKYGMKDDPSGGKIKWSEHVKKLEKYVIDKDEFPILNSDGKDSDGSSGATVHIDTMKEAFDNSSPKVKVRLLDHENYSVYKDLLSN